MVSQRSSGGRDLDPRELRLRRSMATEPPDFPPELSRCTCNTPAFEPHDHAEGCLLGLTPPLSTEPKVHTVQRPEYERGF